MPKTIYRTVTSKRRTSRPKMKRAGVGFDRLLMRLSTASASLAAARRGQ